MSDTEQLTVGGKRRKGTCIASDDHRECEGHIDHCGCSKPEGHFSDHGWHHMVNPINGHLVVYERCPRYAEVMRRNRAAEREAIARAQNAYLEI